MIITFFGFRSNFSLKRSSNFSLNWAHSQKKGHYQSQSRQSKINLERKEQQNKFGAKIGPSRLVYMGAALN
ncbi:MAG TPA: hypothetical protein DCM38_10050 [Gammaproteobacteria bacterium]|nr:hypothetical protein [Gammaproteobacteria bacterium]